MQKLTFAALTALALMPAAQAQLLGTKASFNDSGFCKQYACKYLGTDLLGNNVRQYHYRIGGEWKPNGETEYGTDLTIVRFNGTIISGGFLGGGQDTYLSPYNDQMPIYAGFIRELTGKTPSTNELTALEEEHCAYDDVAKYMVWNTPSGKYGLSCLSMEGLGSRNNSYNIFKL